MNKLNMIRVLALVAIGFLASAVGAFTYIPMADEDLIASGQSVVHGVVTEFRSGDPGNNSTVYSLRLESQEPKIIEVRLPGAHPDFSHGFRVFGAPHFKRGEEVVLILGSPDLNGVFGVTQFALGVFRVVDSVHGKAIVRDISQGHALAQKRVRDQPRLLEGFLRFAESVKEGSRVLDPEGYFIPEADLIQAESQKFTFFENGNGDPLRWRFDQNVIASFSRNGGAQYEDALIDALMALSLAPNTQVSTDFGGETGFSGGTCEQSNRGVNAVLFGDPEGEIDGSFSCSNGGTLGIGGPCFGGSHEYRGATYGTILAGRVVIQDGAECFMDGNQQNNARELLAHELGHALGLGHSCGDSESGPCHNDPVGDDDALMRASAHGDGRGARLGVDDQNALVFLYGVAAVDDPPTISAISSQTIPEDGTTGTLAFTIGDVDTPVGSLTVSAASSNQALIPDANLILGGAGTNRTVTVTPAGDANGGPVTVTLTVDDGATAVESTFQVSVIPENDPPTITAIASQSIDEDSSTDPLTFTIGDVDTSIGSLMVSAASSNQALIPDANLILGGTGPNRTVTVTPASDANGGPVIIGVSVQDSGGGMTESFEVTVNPVNDGPVADDSNLTAAQASPVTVTLTGSDIDGDALTFSIASGPSNGSLGVVAQLSPTTAEVEYTPDAAFNGSDAFTFIVNDGTLASPVATVVIQIDSFDKVFQDRFEQ